MPDTKCAEDRKQNAAVFFKGGVYAFLWVKIPYRIWTEPGKGQKPGSFLLSFLCLSLTKFFEENQFPLSN